MESSLLKNLLNDDTPQEKHRPNNLEHFDINDLQVKPAFTEKSSLPQTPHMSSGILNRFPSMLLNVGRSGSGKSTVVNYLMANKNFIGNFYDQVWLFSPTAEVDDLTKLLKIPKKRQIIRPTESILMKILDDQEKLIKSKGIKHVAKKNKVLIIFDDIISNPKFLKSDAMLKLAAMGRHFLISSIINTQSYTKIPRAIRLQANGIVLFPSNQGEVRLLCDDICPPNTRKKDFMSLIEHATAGKHDFLFANNFEVAERRFRKNFDTILNIE